MDERGKKYLIKKLKMIKYESILQQKDVLIYFIQIYIRCLLKFGISNEITEKKVNGIMVALVMRVR